MTSSTEPEVHNVLHCRHLLNLPHGITTEEKLEMWATAQRDGRPAEYRWRTLFNAAKFG